jgi:hypothetical protein
MSEFKVCSECGLLEGENHNCTKSSTAARNQLFPHGDNKFSSDKLAAQAEALRQKSFKELLASAESEISQGKIIGEALTKKCAEFGCETMLARGARRYCSQHYHTPDRNYQFSTRGGFRYEIKETGSTNILVVYYRTRVVFQHVIRATEDKLDKFDLVKEGRTLA